MFATVFNFEALVLRLMFRFNRSHIVATWMSLCIYSTHWFPQQHESNQENRCLRILSLEITESGSRTTTGRKLGTLANGTKRHSVAQLQSINLLQFEAFSDLHWKWKRDKSKPIKNMSVENSTELIVDQFAWRKRIEASKATGVVAA